MRNRLHRYRYNVVLLLATWLVACSKVPDDIISGKENASCTGGYAIGRSYD